MMKIVYVKEEHISCTGENDDHPRYITHLKMEKPYVATAT